MRAMTLVIFVFRPLLLAAYFFTRTLPLKRLGRDVYMYVNGMRTAGSFYWREARQCLLEIRTEKREHGRRVGGKEISSAWLAFPRSTINKIRIERRELGREGSPG